MSRSALAVDELPKDVVTRREALEQRAQPDRDRPKLSAGSEARLAVVEEKSAQCYIQAEELTFRLHRAATRINDYVPRSTRLPSESGESAI
jgi:hypothetical protein